MSVNVGAFLITADGFERMPSKAALERALKKEPASVIFDLTAAELGPRPDYVTETEILGHPAGPRVLVIDGAVLAEKLGGDILSVCGPSPYHNRRWWAEVLVGVKGVRVR